MQLHVVKEHGRKYQVLNGYGGPSDEQSRPFRTYYCCNVLHQFLEFILTVEKRDGVGMMKRSITLHTLLERWVGVLVCLYGPD